ncbi:BON domain-containing protein [Ralstonia solanacearum]|uniref:Putative lipoprotein transmembrane n=1 Tax=Ralstonia solanacearum CFBP2957 TaxID=859656 RepID=D8P4W7_RALSL|nr:BON domain-containing protein [Ralstonia solanacearum]AYB54165.1 BON domain-containing protein [Ralstonia solanacearum]AYB58721.2 BON domain-containing protein [Ralstonia solanacearum]MDB0527845.1 BON domain-containing protein [Ralstonia solanacearum]MDB0566713.1 BON domain-containing protein [Ralstonia solanacearum]MDB0576246.1 BON domain-containing protein [Ralstonia solanacearum]
MRLSRLAFEVRAGMAHRPTRRLAAACAALALAACGGGEYPYSTGARMADDTLLTYRVKAALDQDTALNARQVRIASTPDGRVILTGWVDTPEMARRAGEDVRRFVDGAKLDNRLRVLPYAPGIGGGPRIAPGLPDVPASAPASR